MNKKSIITMMLALVTMTGLAQTKTATVTGYSPALKDGTLVLAAVGKVSPFFVLPHVAYRRELDGEVL